MNELYHYYEKLLNNFNQVSPCLYRVARYVLGHHTLVLMSESEESSSDKTTRAFITLEGIEYMQVYPVWRDSPLIMAQSELRDSFLQQAKINVSEGKNLPLVFYASPSDKSIFIVCTRIYFSENWPKLTEYTFE